METPNTKAGQVTEEIMRVFSAFSGKDCVIDLETPEYNKVYSHVLRTLQATLGERR